MESLDQAPYPRNVTCPGSLDTARSPLIPCTKSGHDTTRGETSEGWTGRVAMETLTRCVMMFESSSSYKETPTHLVPSTMASRPSPGEMPLT